MDLTIAAAPACSRSRHDAAPRRRRAVLAITTSFLPQSRGDAARNRALISMLRSAGWMVTVVLLTGAGTEVIGAPEMRTECDEFLVWRASREIFPAGSSEVDAWCPDGYARYVSDICAATGAAALVVQHVMLSKCLAFTRARSPKTLLVVDTHDVFSDRLQVFSSAGVVYEGFTTDRGEERAALSRADIVIAQQEADFATFVEYDLPSRVVLLPHPSRAVRLPRAAHRAALFVGDDNDVNVKGVQAFLSYVLPQVRRRFADFRLYLAGRVTDAFGSCEPVVCLGFMEDLAQAYARALVVVNLEACGTGLKIKTAEALLHGRALVTTPAGAQGLEPYGDSFRTGRDWAEFARLLQELLADPASAHLLGDRALQFASWYFDPQMLGERLNSCIANVAGTHGSAQVTC